MKLCDSCVFLWQKTVTALWLSSFKSENVAFDYKSKKDVNHIYIFLTLEKSKESSNVMTTKGLKLEHCYPSINGEDS